MSKSLDRVLQPDGSYKWQEIELIHSGKLIEPVVEPEPEEIVVTEEPVVKQTNDFESMTKKQLEEFGRTIGIELDRRQNKKVLIKELEEKLNPST
jgi:hypothetical protein|tara:strand:- start:199 stop:483 length:285 start_codon:yes stop_codon:yes gene_type:complete